MNKKALIDSMGWFIQKKKKKVQIEKWGEKACKRFVSITSIASCLLEEDTGQVAQLFLA